MSPTFFIGGLSRHLLSGACPDIFYRGNGYAPFITNDESLNRYSRRSGNQSSGDFYSHSYPDICYQGISVNLKSLYLYLALALALALYQDKEQEQD
ncbi:hypothetical protein QUF72_10350 [Desulfobacterales bacterium HSG2]|nr:hypothetical protein [Desulfobacterales bacterium HSG2]